MCMYYVWAQNRFGPEPTWSPNEELKNYDYQILNVNIYPKCCVCTEYRFERKLYMLFLKSLLHFAIAITCLFYIYHMFEWGDVNWTMFILIIFVFLNVQFFSILYFFR